MSCYQNVLPILLTHWDRDIFQCIFLNVIIGSGNDLALSCWQPITWINDDPVQWRIFASPGFDEWSVRETASGANDTGKYSTLIYREWVMAQEKIHHSKTLCIFSGRWSNLFLSCILQMYKQFTTSSLDGSYSNWIYPLQWNIMSWHFKSLATGVFVKYSN